MQELLQTLSSIGQINRILPKDKELLLLFHPHDLYKIENQINFNTLEDDVLLDVFVGMVDVNKCEEIIELSISRLKEENKDIIPFQTCSLDSIYT